MNQGFSMHIIGYMVILKRYVTGDWVIFYDFALSGSVLHGNNDGPLNMHARNIVCISSDSQ